MCGLRISNRLNKVGPPPENEHEISGNRGTHLSNAISEILFGCLGYIGGKKTTQLYIVIILNQ